MTFLSNWQFLVSVVFVAWLLIRWFEKPPAQLAKAIIHVALVLIIFNVVAFLLDGELTDNSGKPIVGPLLLVVIAGLIGGALFSYDPSKSQSEARRITNVEWPFQIELVGLVGIAGAFTIFLVVEVPKLNGGDLNEYLKLIGYSIVGGYGGLAIVRRAFSMVQADLKEEVDELKRQSENDSKLIRFVEQHLELNSEGIPFEKMEQAMKEADERVAKYAYSRTYDELSSEIEGIGKEEKEQLIKRGTGIYSAIATAYPHHYWAAGQLGRWKLELPQKDYAGAAAALKQAILGREKAQGTPIYWYFVNLENALLAQNPNLSPESDDGASIIYGLKQRLTPDYIKWLSSNDRWKDFVSQPIVKWIGEFKDSQGLKLVLQQIKDNGGGAIIKSIQATK